MIRKTNSSARNGSAARTTDIISMWATPDVTNGFSATGDRRDLLRELFVRQDVLADQRVGDDEHQCDGQLARLKVSIARFGVEEDAEQGEGKSKMLETLVNCSISDNDAAAI